MIKCSKERYIQKVPEGFRKWGDASIDEGIQLPNDSLIPSKCIFIANSHPSCDIFTLFSFVLSPEEPLRRSHPSSSLPFGFRIQHWTRKPSSQLACPTSLGSYLGRVSALCHSKDFSDCSVQTTLQTPGSRSVTRLHDHRPSSSAKPLKSPRQSHRVHPNRLASSAKLSGKKTHTHITTTLLHRLDSSFQFS